MNREHSPEQFGFEYPKNGSDSPRDPAALPKRERPALSREEMKKLLDERRDCPECTGIYTQNCNTCQGWRRKNHLPENFQEIINGDQ